MSVQERRDGTAIEFPSPTEGKRGLPRLAAGGYIPGDVMDRIDQISLPRIFDAARPAGDGWELEWEELDLDARMVRRHRTGFGGILRCHRDGTGLFLEVEGPPGGVWVPTAPGADPPPGSRARVGWTRGEPRFTWRYLRGRQGTVQVEARWSFAGLPDDWVRLLLESAPTLHCRGEGIEITLQDEGRDGLAYAGAAPLPAGEPRAMVREFTVEPGVGLWSGGEGVDAAHPWREPASADIKDLRAEIRGRQTRYIANADLDQPVALLVAVPADVLLPDQIPADALAVLPCAARVEEEGMPAEGLGRWRLVPQGDGQLRWGNLPWGEGEVVALAFGRGTVEGHARLRRVRDRRIRLEWQIRAAGSAGGLLALVTERWAAPGGGLANLPALNLNRSGFAARVAAVENGVEEVFDVDNESELPARRLLLDPASERAFDVAGTPLRDTVLYGHLDGHARWRRPAAGSEPGEVSTSEWVAGGGQPLLLLGPDGGGPAWGALHVPDPVRWKSLAELPVVQEEGRLVVEVDAAAADPVWIDLLGHVSRYDRREIRMEDFCGGAPDTAWVARRPLPLFPADSAALLRSFNPLFAVEDQGELLALEPTPPRPTLRVGRTLIGTRRLDVLRVGDDTRLRLVGCPAGEVPGAFPAGAVPGEPSPVAVAQDEEVWLALALPTADDGSEPGGYLVSWSEGERWLLRGFYAPRGRGVRLGTLPCLAEEGADGEAVPMLLRDTEGGGDGGFVLTFAPDPRWDASTPRNIVEAVTDEELKRWRGTHNLHARRCPAVLLPYQQHVRQERGRVTIRFTRAIARVERKLPIRVWRWIPGAEAPEPGPAQGTTIEAAPDTTVPGMAGAPGAGLDASVSRRADPLAGPGAPASGPRRTIGMDEKVAPRGSPAASGEGATPGLPASGPPPPNEGDEGDGGDGGDGRATPSSHASAAPGSAAASGLSAPPKPPAAPASGPPRIIGMDEEGTLPEGPTAPGAVAPDVPAPRGSPAAPGPRRTIGAAQPPARPGDPEPPEAPGPPGGERES